MPGVTRSVVVEARDLEIIRADLKAGRIAAAALIAATPVQLQGARRGATEDGERRAKLLALVERATRMTIEVPESAGGEG